MNDAVYCLNVDNGDMGQAVGKDCRTNFLHASVLVRAISNFIKSSDNSTGIVVLCMVE